MSGDGWVAEEKFVDHLRKEVGKLNDTTPDYKKRRSSRRFICRECETELAAKPYLTLGARPGTINGTPPNGSLVCIACVEQLQKESGTPSRMTAFVKWYWETKCPKVSNLAQRTTQLEEQNALLRKLLEQHGIEVLGVTT